MNTPKLEKYKKLLEEVTQLRKEHEQELATGKYFNIFSELKIERREVLTHSRFIFSLLNPKGKHGQGQTFLDEFLKLLNIPIHEYGVQYSVDREHQTDENKRIDFTVEAADYIIGIEMKIDAVDVKNQLKNYYEYLTSTTSKQVYLFYLTIDGKPASEESRNDLTEREYTRISFEKDIREWLENCIQLIEDKTSIKEALTQYLNLVLKITNTGKHGDLKMDTANILLANEEDLKSACEISKGLQQAKIEIQNIFWENLHGQLIENFTNSDIVIYSSEGTHGNNLKSINKLTKRYYFKPRRSTKHYGIKFKVKESSDKEIYIYINLFHYIHYGIRVEEKGEIKNISSKNQIREATSINKIGKILALADKAPDWLVCFYNSTPKAPKINFDINGFNDSAIALTQKTILTETVKSIVDDIKKLYNSATQIELSS